MADRISAVRIVNLKKTFNIPIEATNGLKQKLINGLKGRKGYREFSPLNGVSFNIEKGDFFGIVGRNGSGKSTLLKTIAGIYAPNDGLVEVNGSLVPFIELGVGFNPELTGRENVFLNGALLGFSRTEMESMYDDIVDFAELEDFMDERLKNYSSGMQVRLAFSIAIKAQGDILLLDEVLAVGDALFQNKCYEYFKKLKHDKKTVILVSHDTGTLQEYCNKGVLIEKGKIICAGKIDKVVNEYINILNKDRENSEIKRVKDSGNHVGSGRATVTSIKVRAGSDKDRLLIEDSDKNIKVTATYKFHNDIDKPIYGLTINDAAGARILAINTMWSRIKTDSKTKGEEVVVDWIIPNIFNSGRFFVSPAIATAGGSEMLDQVDDMAQFQVNKRQISNAATNMAYEMKVS